MTENETVGWHHQLNGHEFEQTSGDSDGQGRLVCASSQGCKESEMKTYMSIILNVMYASQTCQRLDCFTGLCEELAFAFID